MDSSHYAIGVFDSHVARAGLTGKLSGKTVLELGPGDSIATAIIAAAQGAKSILVDTGAFSRTDIGLYLELQKALLPCHSNLGQFCADFPLLGKFTI